MLDYFKRFFAILLHRPAPATNKSAYQLSDSGIVEANGIEHLWSDVNQIGIVTTSEGPFVDDVFYVIKTAKTSLVIDQFSASEIKLFDYFAKFPGFNYEQVILAMSCTDDASFTCWEAAA